MDENWVYQTLLGPIANQGRCLKMEPIIGETYRTSIGGKLNGTVIAIVQREPIRFRVQYSNGVIGTVDSRGIATDGPSNYDLLIADEISLSRGEVTKRSLLESAIETVAGRGLNYGRPEDNFARIANHWNAFLENRFGPEVVTQVRLTPGDVAQLMVLMKIARLENSPTHLDSWTDIAGYAACGAEIECNPETKNEKAPQA